MKNPVLAVFGTTIFYVTTDTVREREVKDGAELGTALLQFVAEAETLPKVLDLVYHPGDFQLVAAECANVSRAKLKAFFAGEIRELTNPTTLWGATTPQPHLDGKYATLLHYEQRPRLEAILQRLEETGVHVRVALPPAASLIDRTRGEHLELALLVAGDCYLLYHVNELGIPQARLVRSFETLAEHVGVALTSRKNPPTVVLLVADVTAERPHSDLIGLFETHGLREQIRPESWADFLRGLTFLSQDPANLAVRPFKWKSQHTLSVLAAALIVAAGLMTYDYATRRIHARQIIRAVDQHRRELLRDVVQLEETERRYHAAEAVVAAVPLLNPKPSVLLDAVTQALPPALQLQAYRYQNGQFTLEGLAYEGVGQEKGPFAQFLDALNGGARPWVFKSPKAALASSVWNLAGTLNP